MATKVDELIIEIKAETAKLRRGLKDVNDKLDKTAKKSKTAVGGLKMIGGAAVVAAFTKLGKTILDVGSGFEDLQTSLNTVFGGMTQGQGAMDRVMDFAKTTPFQVEDATKAFIALKSAGIEPNEKMLQVFADTASVAVDSLGTFEALIRLVQRSAGGGMGLEELNMISDRGINVTGMLQEKLGKSRDELSEFGKTAEGAAKMVEVLVEELGEEFGGAMVQKMELLSTKTSNMTIAFKQLGDAIFKSGMGQFFKDMADHLGNAADAMSRVVRRGSGQATLADFGLTAINPEANLHILRNKQHNALLNMQQIGDRANSPENLSLLQMMGGGNPFDAEDTLKLKDLAMELQSVNLLIVSIEENIRASEAALKTGEKEGVATKFIEFTDQYAKFVKDSQDVKLILAEQLSMLNDISGDEKLMKHFGTTGEEIERVRGHIQGLIDESEDLSETLSDVLAESITQISMSFTKDFVDSLMAGENALDSFKDFSKQIVSTIITTFLQLKVIEPLLNSVFTAFGLPTIPKRAGGGTVQAGRPVLVGERGAEIFVPNTSGHIMNNADSMGVGGGGLVVNQSISFSTGIVPTVRAEVSKMLPQIADVTKFAVLEAAQRGGSYRKGLQGA